MTSKIELLNLLQQWFAQKLQQNQHELSKLSVMQSHATQTTEKLEHTQALINQLKSEIENSTTAQVQIQIKDYLTPEQYQWYLQIKHKPLMLCEFNVPLRDWLDFFYSEFPYIPDKFLIFTDAITGDIINLFEIDTNCEVCCDFETRQIYVNTPISRLYLNLNGLNLFNLLSVEYQQALDDHLGQWESYESIPF